MSVPKNEHKCFQIPSKGWHSVAWAHALYPDCPLNTQPLFSISFSPCIFCLFALLLPFCPPQKKTIQGGKWFTYQIKQQLRAYLLEVFESVSYLFSVWLCVMRDRLRFGWNVATPTLQHLTQPAGTKYCGKTERGGLWDGDEKTGTTCEEAWQPCVFFECICAPRDKTLEFSQSAGVHSACVPSLASHGCNKPHYATTSQLCACAHLWTQLFICMCATLLSGTLVLTHWQPSVGWGTRQD